MTVADLAPSAFLILLAATMAGAFVQAATGFGFALVAAPVYLATLQSAAAIQVLVALHIVQTAMLVPKLLATAPWPLLRRLILGSLVGMPIGLAVFSMLDVDTLKLAVGGMILVFTVLIVARDLKAAQPAAERDREGSREFAVERSPLPGLAVGALSGFLTSLLVMPGPPVILYLMANAAQKQISRAISLTFFGFCYVVVTGLHATVGGMGRREWLLVAALSPVVPLATWAGTTVARHLSESRFRRLVLGTLALSGAYCILTTL